MNYLQWVTNVCFVSWLLLTFVSQSVTIYGVTSVSGVWPGDISIVWEAVTSEGRLAITRETIDKNWGSADERMSCLQPTQQELSHFDTKQIPQLSCDRCEQLLSNRLFRSQFSESIVELDTIFQQSFPEYWSKSSWNKVIQSKVTVAFSFNTWHEIFKELNLLI